MVADLVRYYSRTTISHSCSCGFVFLSFCLFVFLSFCLFVINEYERDLLKTLPWWCNLIMCGIQVFSILFVGNFCWSWEVFAKISLCHMALHYKKRRDLCWLWNKGLSESTIKKKSRLIGRGNGAVMVAYGTKPLTVWVLIHFASVWSIGLFWEGGFGFQTVQFSL